MECSVCAAELLRCADGKKSRLRGEMDNSRTGLGVVQATPIATKTHPASPPLLLLPPRRGGCPRAQRLPAGEAPTVSVMAIESEVFGSCGGEIDVSVGMENRGAWICCGWKYLGFIWGVKSGSGLAE